MDTNEKIGEVERAGGRQTIQIPCLEWRVEKRAPVKIRRELPVVRSWREPAVDFDEQWWPEEMSVTIHLK